VATTRSATILLGLMAASLTLLGGCSQEDYYCDDDGCYYCDGLGCRAIDPPERGDCLCNADCGGGSECTALGCTATCEATDDCARGTVCEGGFCVHPTETAPSAAIACVCTSNEECDRFEDGDDLVCVDGSCVPAVVPTCGDTRPCAGGLVCVDGECRTPDDICHFSVECGPGRVCVDQHCTSGCGLDNPCPTGSTCEAGFCREIPGTGSCTNNSDCDAGDVCVDGACWDGCTADAECGAGRYCGVDGRCRADDRTQPFCTVNGDCAPGAVCADGVCRSPCETVTDCRAFDEQLTFCIEMLCYTTNEGTSDCTSSADCDSGQACVDGICR
jgi:hypothetical protein